MSAPRIRTAAPAPGADPVYECPCVRRSVAALEANVDEKYRTADAYANAIAVGVLNCRCKAEILDACCAPVCPRCKQADCLGPTVAANRGGCRMDTWADVG